MEFVELTEEEFNEFTKEYKTASYMQTTDLKHFKENNNTKCYLVGVKEKNKIVAATLMYTIGSFMGKKRFYASRGLLVDYENIELLTFFTNNLKKYIKDNNGMSLTIDPNVIYRIRNTNGEIINDDKNDVVINNLKRLGYEHFGFNNYFETLQVRWVYRLDMKDTYEHLKDSFSKSTRKNIESVYNYGVRTRVGKIEDINSLVNIYKETSARDGFNVKDYDYYKSMYESMPNIMKITMAYIDTKLAYEKAKEKLEEEIKNNEEIKIKLDTDMVGKKLLNKKELSDKLIEKYKEELKDTEEMLNNNPNGIDIGALVSMKSGNEYISLSSGTLTNYKKYNPKYALYDAHMKDAYELKCEYINFYGIAGDFNPKNKFYGIYEIKKGFNGNVIEYIGEFTLPISFKYKIFKFLKKIKSLIK